MSRIWLIICLIFTFSALPTAIYNLDYETNNAFGIQHDDQCTFGTFEEITGYAGLTAERKQFIRARCMRNNQTKHVDNVTIVPFEGHEKYGLLLGSTKEIDTVFMGDEIVQCTKCAVILPYERVNFAVDYTKLFSTCSK